MEQTGSFEYTKQVLQQCKELTEKSIQDLGGNSDLEHIVSSLSKEK